MKSLGITLLTIIAIVVLLIMIGNRGRKTDIASSSRKNTSVPSPTSVANSPSSENESTFKFTEELIQYSLILPPTSIVNDSTITIGENKYLITTNVGGAGLCSDEDYNNKICGYTNEDSAAWKTIRIWKYNGNIFAVNPQTSNIGSLSALIITKQSPTTFFSTDEMNTWEKIVDSLKIAK